MSWSRAQLAGLAAITAGAVAVIAIGLTWAWRVTSAWDGISAMSYFTYALIFGAVLLAIGAVMAFYVVMIIRKNERAGGSGK